MRAPRAPALLAAIVHLALAGAAGTRTSTAPVDLNHAPQAELQTLPGIGPAKARAIVDRRSRRPFRHVRELLKIKGIGAKTLRRLRPMVTVTPQKRGSRPEVTH